MLMHVIRCVEGVVSAQDQLSYDTDDEFTPYHQYY